MGLGGCSGGYGLLLGFYGVVVCVIGRIGAVGLGLLFVWRDVRIVG